MGLPRRRGVRRTRDPRCHLTRRPRAPRQPRLRGELQSPAPRRTGARQRQDHPGARGHVPRRRVERHQGDLGFALGRTAHEGQGRRPAPEDELHRGRRVPAAHQRPWQRDPRDVLRTGSPAAQDGGAPVRRGPHAAPPWWPRLPQTVCGLQDGAREPRQRAPHRNPLQDGEGLDARSRHRGAQCHPPDQEDDS